MSDQASLPEEAPLLNPIQRVVNLFIAPSKTFADVKRSSGWWVPFLIAAVIGLGYSYVLLHKIGLPALVDGVIRQSPALQSRIAGAAPEDAARIHSSIETQFKFLYLGPVISLIVGLACAGILLASANFGAGGRATYKSMLGVWFYGGLPLVVFYLLVIVAIYAGVTGDNFGIKNPIGTNVGFYLADADLPKMLMPVLAAMDLFAIWAAILFTIGVSTVAGIKRGAAGAIVFGWWILVILVQVGFASFS